MAHDSGYARRFLGLLVKQAREEKEWDQQYLADELDIDIRTLYNGPLVKTTLEEIIVNTF